MKPKLIISVSSEEEFAAAAGFNPDLIEIRIDLLAEDERDPEIFRDESTIQKIGTIRSRDEGGHFSGTPEDFFEMVEPWLSVCDYIDLERPFIRFAPNIRNAGKKIITSVHLNYMPEGEELLAIGDELKKTGDIPKIIVTPSDRSDVLALSEFTLNFPKPAITGVMGEEFRWARALCCLFGSYGVFCYAGTPASPGQYHIDEMREILGLLDNNPD